MAYTYDVIIKTTLDTSGTKNAGRDVQNQLSSVQRIVQSVQREVERLNKHAETSAKVLADKKIKEESRAAKEVERINAQTRRQSEQQEKIRERAAKSLADVQIREGKRAASEMIRSLKQIQGETEKLGKNAKGIFESVFGGAFLGNLASNAVGKLLNGLQSVLNFFTDSIQKAAEFQGLVIGLENVSNNALDARNKVAELAEVAARTAGLDFKNAVIGQQRLQAVGFEADRATRLLEGLARVRVMSNSTRQDFEAVILNLQQIRSMGKLTGDELRETVSRMPYMARVINDAFGTMDSKKINGQIKNIDELFTKLEQSMLKIPPSAGGVSMAWENLDDAVYRLQITLGGFITQNPAVLAMLQTWTDQIEGTTDAVKNQTKEQKRNTDNFITGLARVLAASGPAAKAVVQIFAQMGAAIGVALTATVGSVLYTIETAVQGIINSVQFAVNTMHGIVNTAIGFARNMPDAVKTLMPTWGLIGNLPDLPMMQDVKVNLGSEVFFDGMRKSAKDFSDLSADIKKSLEQTAYSIYRFEEHRQKAMRENDRRNAENAARKIVGARNDFGNVTPDDISNLGGTGRKRKALSEDERNYRDLKRFVEGEGFSVTSTTGGSHMKGSMHYVGKAVDVSVRGKTVDEIARIIAEALEKGFRVVDERVKRTKEWSGPHLHLESNSSRESLIGDKPGLSYGKIPVSLLRKLDDRRFEKARGGISDKDIKEEAEAINKYQIALDYFRGLQSLYGASIITIPAERDDAVKLYEEVVKSPAFGRQRRALMPGQRPRIVAGREVTEMPFPERLPDGSTRERFAIENPEVGLRREIESLKTRTAAMKIREREIAALTEERDLWEQINRTQDDIANFDINSPLRVQAALLEDILDLRRKEEDAIISINRSQLDLSQQMQISNNQIRAQVLEHLASQRTMNESIADGIIGTYEAAADKATESLDKLNEKTKGFLSFLIEPAKAIARNTLTNVTRSLLDRFFPGLGGEIATTNNPIARPIVTEQQKTNQILGRIESSLTFGGGGTASFSGASAIARLGNLVSGNGNFGLAGFAGGSIGGLPVSGVSSQNIMSQLLRPTPNVAGGGSRSGGFFGNLRNLFSTKEGGFFAPRQNVLTGKESRLGGILGGVGSLAALGGSLIGGRVGGVVSGIGTGLSIGSMFGPWGAVAGAAIGGLFSLFGGDPKRKADKRENLPALQSGFTDAFAEFSKLIGDVEALRVNPPSEALSRAGELRAQIASGFGIQFQSKKYRREAQNLISAKLAEIDRRPGGLMERLETAVKRAEVASERQRRILPEFATGGFVGRVPGMFDGRDNKLIRVSGNEVVLNPRQWQPIAPYLQSAGVPGFAGGGSTAAAPSMSGMTLVLNGVAVTDQVEAYLLSETGQKLAVSIVNNAKLNGELS